MRCACGGSYEEGFIPDFAQAASYTSVWIAGAPTTDKPLGQVLRTGTGVRVDGREVKRIEAFCCTTCGRIELYARQNPDPKTTPARSG